MRGWWKSKRFCEVPQAARRGGGRGDRVRRASRRSGPTATWTRRGSTTGGPHRGGYLGVAGGVAWMQEGHSPDESWVGVREVLSQYGKSIANVGASQGTSGHGQFGVAVGALQGRQDRRFIAILNRRQVRFTQCCVSRVFEGSGPGRPDGSRNAGIPCPSTSGNTERASSSSTTSQAVGARRDAHPAWPTGVVQRRGLSRCRQRRPPLHRCSSRSSGAHRHHR